MQSIRQYRKFRTAAKVQLERDRIKAQNLRRQHREHDGGFREPPSPSSDDSGQEAKKCHVDNPPLRDSRGDQYVPGDTTEDLYYPSPASGVPSLPEDYQSNAPHEKEEEEARPEQLADEDADKEAAEEDEEDGNVLSHQWTTLSRMTTQQSARTALGYALTGIHVRKRSTKEGGEGNVFVVGFQGPADPNNPHNWSLSVRIPCTFLIAGIGCVVGIASAIDSSALREAAKAFGVSEVVESMATGLFLVGFGCGALFAGPISETIGRNPVYIVTLALYMIFVMASALSPNIGAQLAFRFIAGVFGSTPLTCAGGSISDLWNPLERVFAFPIFANAAFTGPLLGPIIGGYIAEYLDWRWVEWVTLIVSGAVLILVIVFQPETYPPILLKWKAKHLRDLTGDQRYRAEIEIRQETLPRRLKSALYRPFVLTAREPIIILIALYLTVIYIVLFTFLDGYVYVFTETYGISQGLTGVCFVGIVIGLFGASALVPLIYKWAKRDLAKIKKNGGSRLPPEFRLWYSMLGGAFAIPVSLFWMGWTDRPSISIWSPLAASVLFGYGILCVFITCYQYIIDAYEIYAASALASVTLIRYVAAGGMVIVGIPFYENLGVPYTLTILGCLSAILVPVPYAFYKYGPWIRAKSKYAIDAIS